MREDFNASYWSGRYSVNLKHVCNFIVGSDDDLVNGGGDEGGEGGGINNKSVAEMILITGKYLNVILECGESIDSPYENEIPYVPMNGFTHTAAVVTATATATATATNNNGVFLYENLVSEAFEFSSRKLLNLMLGQYQVCERSERALKKNEKYIRATTKLKVFARRSSWNGSNRSSATSCSTRVTFSSNSWTLRRGS